MINFNIIPNPASDIWVVFINGAGASIRTWKRQSDALHPYAKLLLIDLRDHGASLSIDPSPRQYDFELISNDIKEVLDHLKITKAHFITLSRDCFDSGFIITLSQLYWEISDGRRYI